MKNIEEIFSEKWNFSTDEVSKMISDDEKFFEQVYNQFLHGEGRVAHRSGFFLGRVFKSRPEWLLPRITEMLSMMKAPPHKWFQWYVVWYLSHCKFPPEHDSLAATYAFEQLGKSYANPAVKNASMRLLTFVCKRNTELIPNTNYTWKR